jgi:hypothetical protein
MRLSTTCNFTHIGAIPMKTLTVAALTDLLIAAKDGHTRFENETGTVDHEWQKWYAAFILKAMQAEGYLPTEPAVPFHHRAHALQLHEV